MKGHTARPAGLSVAVAIDGQIVWSEGFGFADLEQQVPVTTVTKFRIGSVSKVLAIAALAELYEQGRLDIDAPVQKYVPSFPDKGYVITTRIGGAFRRHPALETMSLLTKNDLRIWSTACHCLKMIL